MTRTTSYFFVHIMKTGGTTFVHQVEGNFPAAQRYPLSSLGEDHVRDYFIVKNLMSVPAGQRADIRFFAGHFPSAAADLVGADVTITLLREPVERTISYLKQCKRMEERLRDHTLEEIYDDPWMFPLAIHDFQVRQFARSGDEDVDTPFDVFDVDDARLEIAIANLERVDLIGLNDHYDTFVGEAADRYGWKIAETENLQVSKEDWDVSPELRRRIEEENAADVAFYAHACELHRSRHRTQDRSPRR